MSNQIVQSNNTGIDQIKRVMMSSEVRERFEGMVGANAGSYLNQVMSVVAQSKSLQQCTPVSILVSAVRAASLRLSVDPAQGQAWIIAYKGQATFQIGYRGVYELAMRTGKYRLINTFRVYKGQEVVEDQITGRITLAGKKESSFDVIGWGLYFELFNGFSKTFYMSCEEIADHAKAYSQSYDNPRSPWNDARERPKMERKTVLSRGLRLYGVFNIGDKETLEAIEAEEGFHSFDDIDPEMLSDPEPDPVITKEQAMSDLGYDNEPVEGEVVKPQTVQDKFSELSKTNPGYSAKSIQTAIYASKIVREASPLADIGEWFSFYKGYIGEKMKPAEAAGAADSDFKALMKDRSQTSMPLE